MDNFEENYKYFQNLIHECLLEKDINYFTEFLSPLLTEQEVKSIHQCNRNEKVNNFISIFDKLKNPSKYHKFKEAAKVHNQWIDNFLNINIQDGPACDQIKIKWIILNNTLNLIKDMKNSFHFDEVFVQELFQKEIISKSNKDFLLKSIKSEGEETTLYELFDVISMKDPDWYGNLLYIIGKQNSALFNSLCEDLNTDDVEHGCHDYAKKFIDKHVQQYKQENSIKDNYLDLCSDYGSFNEEEISDCEDILDVPDVPDLPDEDGPKELILRDFQIELAEIAISGKNVIIYAPTGSGKTNVAVHISNEHLKRNPNGKIAFLVHRIPLVSQQYKVFHKYKIQNVNVINIRGKSDNLAGPLIFNMESNNIIIMTSDLLRNALTVDDGNKISSISEFSLIFFDECHNCMKSHPYTKIMLEYFKVKRSNPNAKLPQIVGLTASPRSNKKDDLPGITKSLFELCANLDCFDISMVKKHKLELESFIAQPKPQTIITNNRIIDKFEPLLIKQMENCEKKLEKMKREKYFPSSAVIQIPTNKLQEEYVGFVGNLEKLNTLTTDENDGKQKAFSIFRFLNAFYRGLKVNQMFDLNYAQRSIKRHLKHNGKDFTCTFDEEFYTDYKNEILNVEHEQSSNPAIDEIIKHIHNQLLENPDSRILIFAMEIDFSCYMADLLNNIYNIPAEPIAGSNAKTDSQVCTNSENINILTRFHNGKTKVLVSTTVVEEGLDIALCNMVISYGHVTNETAMIQRRGRVRALNSKYILILPPILSWLEKKEKLNELRREKMMKVISQLENLDYNEMKNSIQEFQNFHFYDKEKKPLAKIQKIAWNFSCKNCQTIICTSDYIRIIEKAHRICIIPELLNKFTVIKEERMSFGRQGLYEYGGKVLCITCKNFQLGNYVYYKKIPFFQLKIQSCNLSNKSKDNCLSLKKWDQFTVHCELKVLSAEDQKTYIENLIKLELINENDIVEEK